MGSEMMTAAILNQVSSPMRIERIPVPQPRAGEALVRVHACGVCHTDLHVIKGEVAFPTPAVPRSRNLRNRRSVRPGHRWSRERHTNRGAIHHAVRHVHALRSRPR
jgi:hypothetical protein